MNKEPLWGRQGEWIAYRQDAGKRHSPLLSSAGAGYKEDDWENAYIKAELTYAQDIKTWADKLLAIDRAYRSRLEKLELEFQQALEQGYEEAYAIVKEMQAGIKLKDERIALLEERLTGYSDCHQQVS